MQLQEQLNTKWKPVLDHPDLPEIKDAHRRAVTAICLENVEQQYQADGQTGMLSEGTPVTGMLTTTAVGVGGAAGGTDAGQVGIDFADPVLISMVRRAMPQLIAYDVCGVQPMSGPTGLIFALRARTDSQSGAELLYNEAGHTTQDKTSGAATGTGDIKNVPGLLIHTDGTANVSANVYSSTVGMTTAAGEANISQEMSFSIEKISVAAGTRALKGSYSMELQQDLRAVHGLDAEAELANILSAEILAEINREVVRKIYINAKLGAAVGTTSAGMFDLDTDSNGRWMVEKFKGLMMQIERDANSIAKDTRRGKGNILITSSDVASALAMAGQLSGQPTGNDFDPDDTGTTMVGTLNGRYKVFVDPYAPSSATNYFTVGYKGSSAYDAGLFYCPYVPLQMVRAVGENSFQPKIGFKTRYGLVSNPFANDTSSANNGAGDGSLTANANRYYRHVIVANLM